MKHFKVTTVRGFGELFVRTVAAENADEAINKVESAENHNVVIAFCEEV